MQQVYPHSVLFQLNNRQWLTKSFDDPAIRTTANELIVLTDPPGVSDLTHTECKVTLSCATTIGSWVVFVKGIQIRSCLMKLQRKEENNQHYSTSQPVLTINQAKGHRNVCTTTQGFEILHWVLSQKKYQDSIKKKKKSRTILFLG